MEQTVKLSKRLTAIAEFVKKDSVVADIGCDHGFVSIYLIQSGIAKKVIAGDINEGPLLRAKEHVEEYGLSDCIELRLSDGMQAFSKEDGVDLAVIAGMGGRMMIHILSQAMERDLFVKELVLQPQSEWQELRAFLRKAGYQILDETMVLEEGKYYPVLKLQYCQRGKTEENQKNESEMNQELLDSFGPVLLQKKHPVLQKYIQKELAKFMPIFAALDSNHKSYDEMQQKIMKLQTAQNKMEE